MSKNEIDAAELAERHAATAAAFTEKVAAVTDWDVPSPVAEWTARDVVRHLVDWSRSMLGQAEGITFGEIPSVEEDPLACWQRHTEQMQLLLEHPEIEKVTLPSEPFSKTTFQQAVDQYYIPDVFMHTWDLAKATGQEPGLDQATCFAMYRDMKGAEQQLRASGQFGEQQPVAEDASSEEKLMAFIGRDPYWTTPVDEQDAAARR